MTLLKIGLVGIRMKSAFQTEKQKKIIVKMLYEVLFGMMQE